MASLESLSKKFLQDYSDTATALLCLDYVFQKAINIQVASGDTVLRTLQSFAAYVREMQGLVSRPDPCSQPEVQKLLGLSQKTDSDSETALVVRKGSFLHSVVSQSRRVPSLITGDDGNHLVSGMELTTVMRDALHDRLSRKTNNEDFICSKTQALRLCPAFITFGSCNSECSSSHDDKEVGREAFCLRVRLALQQILICQSTRLPDARWKQQM